MQSDYLDETNVKGAADKVERDYFGVCEKTNLCFIVVNIATPHNPTSNSSHNLSRSAGSPSRHLNPALINLSTWPFAAIVRVSGDLPLRSIA